MVKRRKIWRKRSAPIALAQSLPGLLRHMGGSPLRAKLASLWRDWDSILGPDLASLALPLGAKDDVLLIGAEDAMGIQELHFLADDILERINASLGWDAFQAVRPMLAREGKNCPMTEKFSPPAPAERPNPKASVTTRLSGRYLKDMDPASPIARCYARFANRRS